ncbi:MAG TPA: hypothetical protein VI564_09200 [Candidatus Nanoarchaeia archaeon]|nr:hypothetical protein [Candidatus Nanoarchaeia archaeon]
MANIKSQISIEYLILTAFVFGTIVLFAVILLQTFTGDSTSNLLSEQKINDIGNDLLTKSKQVYYLGLYSKQISTYDFPDGISEFYILQIQKDGKDSYYIGITTKEKKEKKYFFLSDVPLMSEDPFVDSTMTLPECSAALCRFYRFSGRYTNKGIKKYSTEVRLDGQTAKVSITPAD